MATAKAHHRPTLAERVALRLYRHMAPASRLALVDALARDAEACAYQRLRQFGFAPDSIIDVGAHRGDWTRTARAVFGPVPTLMVEALPALAPTLTELAAATPGVAFVPAVLSDRADEAVTFHVMGTGSSFLPEASDAPRDTITLRTRTLDDVAAAGLPDARALFVKIDVQGAELHVLRGGAATLTRAALVQLEVAMLDYNVGAPTAADVLAFMHDRGFGPVEVSGYSRPADRLVQIDMLFAPVGSPLRPRHFAFG